MFSWLLVPDRVLLDPHVVPLDPCVSGSICVCVKVHLCLQEALIRSVGGSSVWSVTECSLSSLCLQSCWQSWTDTSLSPLSTPATEHCPPAPTTPPTCPKVASLQGREERPEAELSSSCWEVEPVLYPPPAAPTWAWGSTLTLNWPPRLPAASSTCSEYHLSLCVTAWVWDNFLCL